MRHHKVCNTKYYLDLKTLRHNSIAVDHCAMCTVYCACSIYDHDMLELIGQTYLRFNRIYCQSLSTLVVVVVDTRDWTSHGIRCCCGNLEKAKFGLFWQLNWRCVFRCFVLTIFRLFVIKF